MKRSVSSARRRPWKGRLLQAGAAPFPCFRLTIGEGRRHQFQDLSPAFRGISLAWNCPSKTDVDAAIDRAYRAGATVQKSAVDVFWGGYSGYFFDPDGHLWEVAYNPHFALTGDGRLTLPN
jgi:catechol 2,3-dioxygenase-like lactoylglutathione lyase family enzyme